LLRRGACGVMVQFSDLTKAFVTYKEFWGHEYKEEELISFIKTIPARMCLCVISQLTAFPDRGDTPELRNGFLQFLKERAIERGYRSLVEHFEDQLKDRVLYSTQGLLASAKWILAYGDFEQEESSDPQFAILAVIYICMIVSDRIGIVSKEDLPYDLVRNAQFNHREDWAAELIRTIYICNEIARDKSLYNDEDFVDFNTDFEAHYGFAILQYASVIFGLYAYFANDARTINANCFTKLKDLFSKTYLNEIANKITAEMMLPLDDAKQWALANLHEDWDFTLFWQKPFLTIDGQTAIPLFYRTIYSNFFISLKIKIERCYTGQAKKKFQTFWGKPFEQYLAQLLDASIREKSAGTLIKEFEYTGKKSPDALVRFGKRRLLAFESKAMYMRKDSIFYSKIEPIKEEIDRLVIDPLCQLHERLTELTPPNKWVDLTLIKDVYLFAVSMSGIPTNPPLERKILMRLKPDLTLPLVRGYYYLSIEDLELLCSLIENPPKGRSIFNLLDKITQSGLTFHNYILSTYKIRRPRLIDEKHKEIFKQITETIKFKRDKE
jgi:hypothetical protein